MANGVRMEPYIYDHNQVERSEVEGFEPHVLARRDCVKQCSRET